MHESRFNSSFVRGRWDRNRTCNLRLWRPLPPIHPRSTLLANRLVSPHSSINVVQGRSHQFMRHAVYHAVSAIEQVFGTSARRWGWCCHGTGEVGRSDLRASEDHQSLAGCEAALPRRVGLLRGSAHRWAATSGCGADDLRVCREEYAADSADRAAEHQHPGQHSKDDDDNRYGGSIR
jgi:hypothetical protein